MADHPEGTVKIRPTDEVLASNRGQRHGGLLRKFNLMSSALRAWKRFVFLWLLAGIATVVVAQNSYAPQGEEYPISGPLPGDQVFPQVAIGTNGGYLVWQDNVTDGDGWGIALGRVGLVDDRITDTDGQEYQRCCRGKDLEVRPFHGVSGSPDQFCHVASRRFFAHGGIDR